MENRDRAMHFEVDTDVRLVLEFMQGHIRADKLVGVSESVAQMERLLWGRYLQEPVAPISLTITKPRPSLSVASGSSLVEPCAGDGSVVASADQPCAQPL